MRVAVTGLAIGGDGIGRDPDGRAVFVPGALPGDLVDAVVVEEKRRFARAEVARVVEASPDRVEPPCPELLRGCGGCDLQHARPDAQRRLRRQLVVDALERIGRLPAPVVVDGPPLATQGFRTTLRLGVEPGTGRASLRRARSNDLVALDGCLVAHPLLEELVVEGRWGRATEVTLRVSAATGERLAIVAPSLEGAGRGAVTVPAGTVVVGADDQGSGACITEVVDGRPWRISAGSFFQTRPDGAEALLQVARQELHAAGVAADARLVDAYCGVGLFSAALPDAPVIAVDASRPATADAEVNLARDGRAVRVRCEPFERWRPEPADAVVADPARRGLGAAGAGVVAATGAPTVVLVSCDAASLGRDAAELGRLGYDLVRSTLVDLFPHTSHVEVVSRFRRR